MSNLPSPTTPAMTPEVRDAVYTFWSWLSLLLGAVIVGWAVLGDPPPLLLAISVGLNFVGAGCGFLAKSYVPRQEG